MFQLIHQFIILSTATIKFFGNLARMEPSEIIEKHTGFLRTTFNLLSSHDPAMVGTAVDTIGVIGESAAGKRALDKQGNLHKINTWILVTGC